MLQIFQKPNKLKAYSYIYEGSRCSCKSSTVQDLIKITFFLTANKQ